MPTTAADNLSLFSEEAPPKASETAQDVLGEETVAPDPKGTQGAAEGHQRRVNANGRHLCPDCGALLHDGFKCGLHLTKGAGK